jgi:hypothetical protein
MNTTWLWIIWSNPIAMDRYGVLGSDPIQSSIPSAAVRTFGRF